VPGTAAPATPAAADAVPAADPAVDPAADPTPVAGAAPISAPDAAPDAAKPSPELTAAQRELGRLKAELKKRDDAAKATAEAELTELQKAQKRITELEEVDAKREADRAASVLRSHIVAGAARAGFADPDDAVRLVDQGSLELDDAGNPTNLGNVLRDLLKAKPYLRSSTTLPADLGQGDRGRSTLTVEQIKAMTPDQINARWDEVQQVLSQAPRSR